LAEAAQFPEKEYINGIAVAVYAPISNYENFRRYAYVKVNHALVSTTQEISEIILESEGFSILFLYV
jgi:hypothetical protein